MSLTFTLRTQLETVAVVATKAGRAEAARAECRDRIEAQRQWAPRPATVRAALAAFEESRPLPGVQPLAKAAHGYVAPPRPPVVLPALPSGRARPRPVPARSTQTAEERKAARMAAELARATLAAKRRAVESELAAQLAALEGARRSLWAAHDAEKRAVRAKERVEADVKALEARQLDEAAAKRRVLQLAKRAASGKVRAPEVYAAKAAWERHAEAVRLLEATVAEGHDGRVQAQYEAWAAEEAVQAAKAALGKAQEAVGRAQDALYEVRGAGSGGGGGQRSTRRLERDGRREARGPVSSCERAA